MNQVETYVLQLTVPQIQLIAGLLQEAPFRLSAPLIAEIQRQVAEADKAREATVNDEAA